MSETALVRLVPRQLRRSDFPSSVPYYGGRLTPDVIAGLGQQATASPPPPAPPVPRTETPPRPARAVEEQLAVLEQLRVDDVITDDELHEMRRRLTGGG